VLSQLEEKKRTKKSEKKIARLMQACRAMMQAGAAGLMSSALSLR
jgi:hypothetical protein